MATLSVTVAGVKLRNPIVVASSPLTSDIRRIKKAESCGAAAVSIKHAMAEQPFRGTPRYFVDPQLGIIVCSDRRLDIEESERIIAEAKEKTNLVVIANMSGPHSNLDGWGKTAQRLVAAGADMIELNMNCPNMGLGDCVGGNAVLGATGRPPLLGASVGQVPELAGAVTRAVKSAVSVPVMPKLTSEGGSILAVAKACAEAGADALNVRASFVAAPGIDIYDDGKPVVTGLKGKANIAGLTGRWSRLISNRFIAQVAQTVPTPIMGAGGISQWEHVVEKIMYGSSCVQICTALVLNGFEIIPRMLNKLESYLERQGYDDFSAVRGVALKHIVAAPQLEFVPVVSTVDEELCNGCAKCARVGTCSAIEMKDKKAVVTAEECVGCSVCKWLCPTKAITMRHTQTALNAG